MLPLFYILLHNLLIKYIKNNFFYIIIYYKYYIYILYNGVNKKLYFYLFSLKFAIFQYIIMILLKNILEYK